ncbi:MAG: MFS transporter [Desulfobacteraceae bacterium]|nr:MFS transporter [Desulfobacteraceae bacterium]
MSQTSKANIKVMFALTLIHFTGDFYSSFTSPLFPLFVEKLGLSLTQVGAIAGINRILAFIVQPSIGYLADRYQTRGFILAGLLLPIVFIPLSGLANGYWPLMVTIAVGSIGSSMFHPSVTGMVPLYSGNKTGFAMSVFNTGGTLAFGLGPLFITWYAFRFGLAALPFTMLLGLIAFVYITIVVPAPQSEGMRNLGFFGAIRQALGPSWKIVASIWLVMFLRAITGQSFLTFMPVFYVEKGFNLISSGVIFALFTVAGTFSGLLSGYISDRIGYKPVFIITHLLMTPVLIIFLHLQGSWVYLGSIMAGAMVLATMPLGVSMAQIIAPKARSMMASLMMGLAYGLGGAVAPIVGKLADLYSIHTVLMCMALVPLLTLPLIFSFPKVSNAN